MTNRKQAVIIGATRGVGRALVDAFARENFDLVIAARDAHAVHAVASDASARHDVRVTPLPLDLCGGDDALDGWYRACSVAAPDPDVVLFPAGVVDDADDGFAPWATVDAIMATNLVSVMKLASRFLSTFEARGRGTVVLFSSIAAAAPRGRNVAYAAAKAGLERYATSMNHRFAQRDVFVQVYALGYVDTPSSAGRRVRFVPAASPARVAHEVVRNVHRRRRLVYFPKMWRPVVRTLGLLPWSVYKRLRF
jgi:short-subunit dehydrogenase